MTIHTYTIPYEGEEYKVTIEISGDDMEMSFIEGGDLSQDLTWEEMDYLYREAVKRHTEPKLNDIEMLPTGWREQGDCYE